MAPDGVVASVDNLVQLPGTPMEEDHLFEDVEEAQLSAEAASSEMLQQSAMMAVHEKRLDAAVKEFEQTMLMVRSKAKFWHHIVNFFRKAVGWVKKVAKKVVNVAKSAWSWLKKAWHSGAIWRRVMKIIKGLAKIGANIVTGVLKMPKFHDIKNWGKVDVFDAIVWAFNK